MLKYFWLAVKKYAFQDTLLDGSALRFLFNVFQFMSKFVGAYLLVNTGACVIVILEISHTLL